MRIRPKGSIAFPVLLAADAAGFKFYFREVGKPDPGDANAVPPVLPGDSDNGELSYNDTNVTIPLSAAVPNAEGTGHVVTVNLGELELPAVDGELRAGLSQYDDVGNESDIGEPVNVPFDSIAPDAPGVGVFTPA